MSQGRKISDDELVEITGGTDGNTDLDVNTITDSGAPAVAPGRDDRTPPGGSTGLDTENSSGGDSGVGPSS